MKGDDSFEGEELPRLVQRSLMRKIRLLNSADSGYSFSLDIGAYEFQDMREESFKIYTCRFIEKKTQKVITVEIKSLE